MTALDRRRLEEPTVYADPDARFRDGFTIGAAFASGVALVLALIALGGAIWFGEF